ncbi:MAG: ABC transporter ATP-binding protein [Desulfobacteraceae bacterium]|jgi:spermidine/putrescine transport system ATP-binding protein
MGQDVEIVNVSMRFGAVEAVRDIDVHIQAGEFFSFLGPSGCGKTTLLRLISGFMEPTAGKIRINGRNMRGIGPNRRPTAMIFQNLALFPLMSVAQNIGFGLEVRGVGRAERDKRVTALLELVDLPGAGDSPVSALSGGQKQRVAIARALAVAPAVLLLDEPLSALDLKLRKHMRLALREIQRRTAVTFVYITHDQGEAFTMSDRVGVMSVGRLEQVDTPEKIYNAPRSAFVASFVGEANRLCGTVAGVENGAAVIDTPSGRIIGQNPAGLGHGAKSTVFVRPETIFVAGQAPGATNTLECTVVGRSFEGAYTAIRLKTRGGETLIMRCNNDGQGWAATAGGNIHIGFKPENALLFPAGECADG